MQQLENLLTGKKAEADQAQALLKESNKAQDILKLKIDAVKLELELVKAEREVAMRLPAADQPVHQVDPPQSIGKRKRSAGDDDEETFQNTGATFPIDLTGVFIPESPSVSSMLNVSAKGRRDDRQTLTITVIIYFQPRNATMNDGSARSTK